MSFKAGTQKFGQLRKSASQQAQKITGGQKFVNGVMFLLFLGVPVFLAYLISESIKIAKKPTDATTDAKVAEVHERHLLGILLGSLICSMLLNIWYVGRETIQKNKLFKVVFVMANAAIAFSVMVIAADAMMRIKGAGKTEEYKAYINMLGIVVAANVVLLLTLILYGFVVGPSAAVAPQKAAPLKV